MANASGKFTKNNISSEQVFFNVNRDKSSNLDANAGYVLQRRLLSLGARRDRQKRFSEYSHWTGGRREYVLCSVRGF